MPINGYFDVVFASSGSVATVPDAVQTDGSVSYTQGYGVNYTLNPTTNPSALNIEQTKFNQLLNDITTAIQLLQRNGASNFITSSMNGGSPYSYNLGATCLYSGQIWLSTAPSNATVPGATGASWVALTASSAVSGIYQNLRGVWASNTTATYTASLLTLQNSSGSTIALSSYNQTVNSGTTGAGGLSTGSLAANTWYAVYAIYDFWGPLRPASLLTPASRLLRYQAVTPTRC